MYTTAGAWGSYAGEIASFLNLHKNKKRGTQQQI